MRGVGELDEVDLQVLARGDVPLLERGVPADDVAECLEVFGGERAAGDLDAHHLHVRLALAVDPAHEAVHDELLLGRPLAVEVAGRLRLEVVDLLGDVGQYALRVVVLPLLLDGLGASDDGAGSGAGHLLLLRYKKAPFSWFAEKGAVFCGVRELSALWSTTTSAHRDGDVHLAGQYSTRWQGGAMGVLRKGAANRPPPEVHPHPRFQRALSPRGRGDSAHGATMSPETFFL